MRIPCGKCGRVEPKTCAKQDCPYFTRTKRALKKDFSGQTPNLFVGRHGYPNIRVGMLATEEYTDNDDPKKWVSDKTSIPDIVDKRASLVNSTFTTNIKSFKDRLLEQAQLVAQSSKPTEMEVSLDKVPSFGVHYPPGAVPHGASVKLLTSEITENVRVPKAIDKAVSDTDLKSVDALRELYGKTDEYALTKLMTAGLLGQGSQRKLVPTRWGITAVDDGLGKQAIEKVREHTVIGEPTAYFGGTYGNYYLVLLFPRKWQYELVELYTGSAKDMDGVWTDHEGFFGRKDYADDTAGGYYASRLPIAEHLNRLKRQASVLVIRFITDEYTNPLGVWVCREATREALAQKPLTFGSKELMLSYAAARAKRFGVDFERAIKSKSKVIASFAQKTLF